MADDFNPDWSLLEATRASLREHMRMAKVLLTQLQDLRDAAAKVMGDHPEIRAADAVIAHYIHPSVLEARAAGVAAVAEPDYATRHKLSDLLDLYREEVACKQYNGWVRQRQPDDIRKEIDVEIERLTNGVKTVDGGQA